MRIYEKNKITYIDLSDTRFSEIGLNLETNTIELESENSKKYIVLHQDVFKSILDLIENIEENTENKLYEVED